MTSTPEAPKPLPAQIPGRIPVRRVIRRGLLVVVGMILGALALFFFQGTKGQGAQDSEIGTRLRPGPWGELYSVPITISAPEELLPAHAVESAGTRWIFKGLDRQQLDRFLNTAGVQSGLAATLMASAREVAGSDFIEMKPPSQAVIAIPDSARKTIYQRLARIPENNVAFFYLHKDTLADRIREDSLSEKTIALFRKLSVEHGNYLVFGGLPALLAETSDSQEKVRFLKCLSRQQTMLLRLKVTKDSDLAALTKYWGKGPYAPNVRSILDALREVRGGAFCSLLAILPPLPCAQAYNYPITLNQQSGDLLANFDCHWTSLSFFRDSAGPHPPGPDYFAKEIAENYSPLTDSPRFGDLLIMTTPGGEIIHTAVFIADEIFFTKNGSTPIYPWMFAKLPDLLKQYSFRAPEGQELVLRYFRHKTL
jgi:hypothetical protein